MSIDKLNSQNADFEIAVLPKLSLRITINNLKVENPAAAFKVKNSNIHNFDLENSAAQFKIDNSLEILIHKHHHGRFRINKHYCQKFRYRA